MKISNVKIYDLEESLIASGYPMRTVAEMREPGEGDWKRGINLTKASDTNPAHAQFLTGVRVNFDLTCSNKMWVEAERYRFLEFVSSQSTMHRITKFDLRNQYNKYVDSRIIEIMMDKVSEYNQLQVELEHVLKGDLISPSTQHFVKKTQERLKELYLEILYSNPAGFELTARMTTNYRCLRNIYLQRHDHRLPEWREFCKWIETLPYANEFLIRKD